MHGKRAGVFSQDNRNAVSFRDVQSRPATGQYHMSVNYVGRAPLLLHLLESVFRSSNERCVIRRLWTMWNQRSRKLAIYGQTSLRHLARSVARFRVKDRSEEHTSELQSRGLISY